MQSRETPLLDARGKEGRSTRVLQIIPTLCTSQHSDLNKINGYPKSRSSSYMFKLFSVLLHVTPVTVLEIYTIGDEKVWPF